MADKPVIILSTFPADHDAATLARTLIGEQLAACVNVLAPMTSIYRWKGAIEQATEHQLIIKTTISQVDAIKERLVALHPYEVPELLVIGVQDGSGAYLDWLDASVRQPPPPAD